MTAAEFCFKPVVVIPVYNHHQSLAAVVRGVRENNLPVILVDDGSDALCARELDRIARDMKAPLVRLPTNGGKGAACLTGFQAARFAGFTHVIQIDADGQHDLSALQRFVEAARSAPEAFVCGCPVYDASVPKARLWGRKLTNFWVHVNTGSRKLADAMCGFRVYPLEATLRVASHAHLSRRMDFDPDIAVRLMWAKVPVFNLPVAVTYPKDGVSHFHSFFDNVRISVMHARLCCLMLARRALALLPH